VRKVLFLVSNLEYNSVAAQLVQLAVSLPGEQFERRVCVLGRSGAWAEKLRQAGVTVDAPGHARLFDLKPVALLRRLVRSFAPDVLHAWALPALRAVTLSGFRGRVIASPCPRSDFARSWLRRLDGQLLRRASQVVALGETEAQRCRALGVDTSRIVIVPPAVTVEPPAIPISGELEGVRFLLCVGPLDLHRGGHDAVWAHDILQFVYPDLHLVFLGAGPERQRLESFAADIKTARLVHFVGEVPEVFSLMRRAEVVWVPGRTETGTQVILEAMAAGKPVVASRFPRMAELVVEGETGLLFPAEDRAALARQTQVLLGDKDLRQRMGEAARRRAKECFRPETLAETCATLYKG
jgi:glycosyltransferase involved in cell wall biosynthesis